MASKKRNTQRRKNGRPGTPPTTQRPAPSNPAAATLILSAYDITDEPLEDRILRRLPPQVRARIPDLFTKVHRAPKEVIPELEHLLATYPDVPPFSNYLCAAYQQAGDTAKAEALIRENYARHPEYLFAKVNYAQICLHKGDTRQIPVIFDHKYDLQQLYPHRKRFHISEFTGFAAVMCGYFCAIGEQEIAALYYRVLEQVAPNHPITRQAKRTLYPPFWIRLLRKWVARHASPTDKAQNQTETRGME